MTMSDVVIVTGGAGYIGSHTIIELISQGYNVVSIDNFCRSAALSLDRVELITGKHVTNYCIDLCDISQVDQTFSKIGSPLAVIHFAAFKSVPESVTNPLLYYSNNILSLRNVLQAGLQYGLKNFVFSSSCSVYGDIDQLPVTEKTVLSKPKSPYAFTKVIGEQIVHDVSRSSKLSAINLRYFNPVGAHTSGLLGEIPFGTPSNLLPVITQTAAKLLPPMTVFGGNLPTRDGSCVRDYVHVQDIANAHVLALQYLDGKSSFIDTLNLGTGQGVSVFEAISSFEHVNGVDVPFNVGAARDGDVTEIYSDATKAQRLLHWAPRFSIEDMVASAWAWQKQLSDLPLPYST